jgi:hypothetical protein
VARPYGRPVAGLHRPHLPSEPPRLLREPAAERRLAHARGCAQQCGARPTRSVPQQREQAHQFDRAAHETRRIAFEARHALAVQRLDGRARLDAQRLLQVVAQVPIPAQRGRPAARRELGAHQLEVRRFVRGLLAGQPLGQARAAQQPQVLVAQAGTRRLGPRLISRLRQQVTRI